MINLDQNEVKIVRELIRNPRISDNQIAKKTKIPVMTVNRKRKRLEKSGFLRYFAAIDTGEFGTGIFTTKQLYIIKFRIGITKEGYLEKLEYNRRMMGFLASYTSLSYLGEKDGKLVLIMILDAKTESELVEEFNGKMIPFIQEQLGKDSIEDVITTKITRTLRRHHNYLPRVNMENGIIKNDWPDEWIFVDKVIPLNSSANNHSSI
jgi:DNA-binding Lrp family transcriptional regulator